MTRISTIVITRDEEERIDRCLASVAPFSDEIVVVDSFSTDRTVEIARAHTPHVHRHEWAGYSAQKEYAVARTSGEWIFWIDADEEASPELQSEIAALDFALDGYRVPRAVFYLGRWIRHGPWVPDRVLRLYRKDRGRLDGSIVHERVVLQGTAGTLASPLYHYPYRDVAHHLEKMNRLTGLAAERMHAHGRTAGPAGILVRPALAFVGAYVWKRGFMDGPAGLVVAMFHAWYVFAKYAKLWEITREGRP